MIDELVDGFAEQFSWEQGADASAAASSDAPVAPAVDPSTGSTLPTDTATEDAVDPATGDTLPADEA